MSTKLFRFSLIIAMIIFIAQSNATSPNIEVFIKDAEENLSKSETYMKTLPKNSWRLEAVKKLNDALKKSLKNYENNNKVDVRRQKHILHEINQLKRFFPTKPPGHQFDEILENARSYFNKLPKDSWKRELMAKLIDRINNDLKNHVEPKEHILREINKLNKFISN